MDMIQLNIDWTVQAVFVDEAHFESAQQHKQFHYVTSNKPGPIYGLAQRSVRCLVSVFCALVGNTLGPLYLVDGNFNGQQYRVVLENTIEPWLREKFPSGKYIYLQDNSAVHHAKALRPFLAAHRDFDREIYFLPP